MVMNNPIHNADIRPSTQHYRKTFLRYLTDFTVVEDEQHLFQQLADCHDPMPQEFASRLGLPVGASYADAIKLLSMHWTD